MEAGQWTTMGEQTEEINEETKEEYSPYGSTRNAKPSQRVGGQSIQAKNFSLVSNSCPKIHKEVKSMVVD